MRVRLIGSFLGLLWVIGGVSAQTPTTVRVCNGTQPDCPLVSASNPFPVSASITPSGTQDVNLTKVGGAAIALGQTTMSASVPVALSSNQSALTVTGAGGTFPVTAASGAFASGSHASGAFASGAFASGSVASGAYASGSLASGAMVDLTNLSTPITPGSATATKGILLGGQYNSTQSTFTNGQQGTLQFSSRGEAKTNIMDAAGNARGANVDASNRLSVTVDNVSATNISTNVAQINAVTPLMGNGATGTGSLRVTIANDNTAPTTWPTSANQIATQAPVAPATATATKSDLVGCQATTAAVNPTTGQQASCSSDTNNNILVSSGGAPNLAISQVSVTTSDTSVAAARALRRSITVQNITGTQDVFCNQTTATTANGVLLAGRGSSFTFNTTSAVRCIAVTATQTVGVAETY